MKTFRLRLRLRLRLHLTLKLPTPRFHNPGFYSFLMRSSILAIGLHNFLSNFNDVILLRDSPSAFLPDSATGSFRLTHDVSFDEGSRYRNTTNSAHAIEDTKQGWFYLQGSESMIFDKM